MSTTVWWYLKNANCRLQLGGILDNVNIINMACKSRQRKTGKKNNKSYSLQHESHISWKCRQGFTCSQASKWKQPITLSSDLNVTYIIAVCACLCVWRQPRRTPYCLQKKKSSNLPRLVRVHAVIWGPHCFYGVTVCTYQGISSGSPTDFSTTKNETNVTFLLKWSQVLFSSIFHYHTSNLVFSIRKSYNIQIRDFLHWTFLNGSVRARKTGFVDWGFINSCIIHIFISKWSELTWK